MLEFWGSWKKHGERRESYQNIGDRVSFTGFSDFLRNFLSFVQGLLLDARLKSCQEVIQIAPMSSPLAKIDVNSVVKCHDGLLSVVLVKLEDEARRK